VREVNTGTARPPCSACVVAVVITGGSSGRGGLPTQ
jgi:hypothetical protein